jgi:hypothetical protein
VLHTPGKQGLATCPYTKLSCSALSLAAVGRHTADAALPPSPLSSWDTLFAIAYFYVYASDVLLNFFVAYHADDGELVTDLRSIAREGGGGGGGGGFVKWLRAYPCVFWWAADNVFRLWAGVHTKLGAVFGWAQKGYLIQRFSRMRIGTARVLSEFWANDMQLTNKNTKATNQFLRLACNGVYHAYDTFEASQCFHSFC